MTSFVHPSFPQQHPGVARFEAAASSVSEIKRGFNSARGLAAMLLAAIVSALLVVASQVVDTWTDGHLLAGWILLWAVGFFALALFANTARRLARSAIGTLDAWSHRVAKRRADARLWAFAQQDARVMADLQAARLREEIAVERAEADAERLEADSINPAGLRLASYHV